MRSGKCSRTGHWPDSPGMHSRSRVQFQLLFGIRNTLERHQSHIGGVAVSQVLAAQWICAAYLQLDQLVEQEACWHETVRPGCATPISLAPLRAADASLAWLCAVATTCPSHAGTAASGWPCTTSNHQGHVRASCGQHRLRYGAPHDEDREKNMTVLIIISPGTEYRKACQEDPECAKTAFGVQDLGGLLNHKSVVSLLSKDVHYE